MTAFLRKPFVVLFVAAATMPAIVNAQRQPRMPTGFREVPTEDQIVAVLQAGDIEDEKIAVMLKARELPPHSLKDRTVKAINNEALKVFARIEALFEANPESRHEGDPEGAYLEGLIGVLIAQQNPVAVEALVMLVPYDGISPVELARTYGEKAIPALVKRARQTERPGELGHIDGALDTLEQMLEQPAIRSTLSTNSRALIRQIAIERMKDSGRLETAGFTFAHAAYLAVATGDLQLRKQVADIVGNDAELLRHGVGVDRQPYYKKVLGEALAKHFEN